MQVRSSRKRELIDVTDEVAARVPAGSGLLHVFVPHTTAGVTLNEGYDPAVVEDILSVTGRLVPEDIPQRHAEGNSDSHALSSIFGVSLFVPVAGGELGLGRWQRIFFVEMDGPRSRRLRLTFLPGEVVGDG
ncbi:YjbQ family protein [Candidatus Fermentibacteria bacterium]|nr:YjbQ family protein [Candidatus Fermentibacteria bacterium]